MSIDTPRPYPTRARVERLFETADAASDPEGIISRFTRSEFSRFQMESTILSGHGLSQRIETLFWYLRDYAPTRPYQSPLSAQQISFLNAGMPILGLAPEISVGAFNFLKSEYLETSKHGFDELNQPRMLLDALIWWIDRAARIAPGGELMTTSQAKFLNRVAPQSAGKLFPLTAFAERIAQTDDQFNGLDHASPVDRAVIVCVLFLRSARQPHLRLLLPSLATGQLLHGVDGEQPAAIDRLLALALSGTEARMALFVEDAIILRSEIEAKLAAHVRIADRKAALSTSGCGIAHCFGERPSIGSQLQQGVALIGPIRATSGLGQAMRLSLRALQAVGEAPAVLDYADNPSPVGFTSGAQAPVLTAARQINIFHVNLEFIPSALSVIDKRVYSDSYNIAYCFWELDGVPESQLLGLDLVDEIWVSSEFLRDVYSSVTDVPVTIMSLPAEDIPMLPVVSRDRWGLHEDAFVFLCAFDAFSFVERKNPAGVIAAFQLAFPLGTHHHVQLLIKTQNRSRVGDPYQLRVWSDIDDAAQRDPRIIVHDETITFPELLALKSQCNCYVSLHRSEGWGFGMVEAMQVGTPVIATGYSANLEFCDPSNCLLVEYRLVEAMPWEYIAVKRGSRWAEPSIESAASAMRTVIDGPLAARQRAEAASAFVSKNLNPVAVGNQYLRRIQSISELI